MKKLNNLKWFTLGIIVCVLTTAFIIPAVASGVTRQADLFFNDIRVTLDGEEIIPRDAHGNIVEPFVIDGTTYLPVRGIGTALGLGVDWDGDTSTVILTTPGAQQQPPPATGNAVQDFLDTYSAEIEAEMAPLAGMMGDGSSISVAAGANNELIYIFTYGSDVETDGLGAILVEVLEGMSSIFEEVARVLQIELGLESFRVTVRYLAYDGTLLAEQSFDA